MAIRSAKIFRLKGATHPSVAGYTKIYPISANAKWNSLSPMKLGPFYTVQEKVVCDLYPDGIHPGFEEEDSDHQKAKVEVFENWYQGSKVYEIDVDAEGNIKESWYLRRQKGFADPVPHRRVFPKKSLAGKCLFAYYSGQRLSYLESRVMYCSVYEELVKDLPKYQELKKRYDSGEKLILLGYDGLRGGEDRDLTHEILDEAYNNLEDPFGHEIVLCCLLMDYRPWEK